MTATNMDLKELLEKTADTDFLREMIGFTAQRLMELEVETLTGATHGAAAAPIAWPTHRNGYRGASGTPGPERSNCAYRRSAKVQLPRLSSRGGWARRR